MPARTRARLFLSLGALLCLAVIVTLSTMVKTQWQPLNDLDHALGSGPQAWTYSHPTVANALIWVERVFDTWPMTVYTILVAGLLLARKHRRAAGFVVLAMVGASLTTYFLKRFFQRDRPVWEDVIHSLSSFSFPSGHSSGIASGMGVAIVLALVLVRRRRLRRSLVTGFVLVALFVGLDRIMLGVHNVSDVAAGFAVGTLWVLLGLLVLDPRPRTRVAETPEPASVPSSRRLAVVLNPIKVEDVAAFKAMVEELAAEHGWLSPAWFETTIEDPGKSMAERAAIGGADLVLVCGGDGTVRTVCAELAGTGIPVGVVPAGTGNLLARNLGIPLYLQAAIETALTGQDRAIDLVAVSGDGLGDEHFMVMAGMGFDAAIMEGASEEVKARIGWLAYVVSGMRQLRYPAARVEISVDDGPFTRHRARTVVIGNVGYLTAGIPLLPDASIDDGVLDVVLVSPRAFLSWVPVAVRVMSKNKRVDAALNRMTGRKVVVRAAHDTPRQLDGDPIGAGREMVAECIHGRLLVRVPR